jgi:hypothetical protein
VTTHRRALLLRAGVVIALVAGGLVVAAPAQAAPGDVTMQLSQGNFDLNPGDKRGLTVRLTNAGNQNQSAKISVSGPGALGGDVTIQTSDPGCTGSGSTGVNCTVDVPKDNGTKDVALTLVAKNPVSLGQGQTKQDNGSVALEFGETKNFSVTLHGPSQAPMVTEVSGTVTDGTTGQAVKDALVVMKDGADANFQFGTDSSGRFKFTSTQDKPIHPGTISVAAGKDQYENSTPKTFDAKAGQSITGIRIGLKPTAAATPTATAQPTDQPTGAATEQPSVANTPPLNAATKSGGTSMLSWVLIGLGAILVLLGIGAILLLVIRRKDDGDGPDEDPDGQPNRRAPTPASRGVYRTADAPAAADRTMVANAGGIDPTMVRGNASDATTMLRPQRPPAGEYGAPAGGYGGAAGAGYGAASGAPAGYGAAPGVPAGYGAAAPGAPGYDGAPTQGGGYGAAYGSPGAGDSDYPDYGSGGASDYPAYGGTPGYRGASGGYSGEPGYGDAGARGYEGGAYQQQQPGANGYGGGNGYSGGYDDQGRYEEYDRHGGGYPDRGGYDDRRGYDDRAGYGGHHAGGHSAGQGGGSHSAGSGGYVPEQRGGYDDNGGGGYGGGYYDDQGGGRRPAPQAGRGEQRPPLDWLDD